MVEATHRLSPLDEGVTEGALVGSHDGRGLRIAVACARFNGGLTARLLDGALRKLDDCGVEQADRLVVWVPGSFELPLAAQAAARAGYDGVACLGVVIRGETAHFDFVAGECARGLQQVQLETGVPVAFGVLTTENAFQALERSGGSVGNKGEETVETVVEMANLVRSLVAGSPPAAGTAATPR